MANVVEYVLSLNDKLSGKLGKIGITNDRQLATWSQVQKKVVAANKVMNDCGVTVGSLKGRIDALRAEREWIPKSNIIAIRKTNQEIESLERQMRKLEATRGGGLRNWFSQLQSAVPAVGLLTSPLLWFGVALRSTTKYIGESSAAWQTQMENETKLAAVMRNTMSAGQDEVNSILKLASAQQKLGIVGDEVQLAGAQELSTYLSKKSSLEKLLPVMNDMIAQQYGFSATGEQAAQIASMMGKVMDGQTGALSRYGYKFTEAQERILKYGTESQRAATLAEVISESVGGVNAALANTPEGRMKQLANEMGDLKEEVGKIYTKFKSALFPLFESLKLMLEGVIDWFKAHEDVVVGFAHVLGTVLAKAFNTLSTVIGWTVDKLGAAVGWVVGVFDSWINKLREGQPVITILTLLLGALVAGMAAYKLKTMAVAAWTGIVSAAQVVWTAVQWALNGALLACPITLIVAGIVVLIATIAYLCYKIEGWGSLWEGVVGFMKYTFYAFVDGVKLYYSTLINGIMMGLDKIKLGWYKFKEACGIGNSEENQAAIAAINADVEARQQAIVDGAKSVIDNAKKAKDSLAGIKMSWNSEKSLSDITSGLKAKLGIQPAEVPGMATDGGGAGTGTFSAGSDTSSPDAVATGGKRNTVINITLGSMVEKIVFEGGYESDRDEMQRDLESTLIRVLQMARAAQ